MSATDDSSAAHRGAITKRLRLAFGSVTIIVVSLCALLISLLWQVSGLVMDMEGGEMAIKDGLTVAMAAREQYMHQAHWLIEGDDEHLHHSHASRAQVERGALALEPRLPPDEQDRATRLRHGSAELQRLFFDEIKPAQLRGDIATVSRLHKAARVLSAEATKEADAIARLVERSMASSHRHATNATELGLLAGGVGVALVIGLSLYFIRRFQTMVLRPLRRLSAAAGRFGAGQFSTRVGAVGEGELRLCSQAFDSMAEELEKREAALIQSERMAVLGQLAAGVAHEILNPIGIIRGYLKTMDPNASTEAARQSLNSELNILDEEAAACQRIAEDLVTFSRAPDLSQAPVDIHQLLQDTVTRFAETPAGSGIAVDLRADERQLYADQKRLRQVVLNLLQNAAQMSNGEPIEICGEAEAQIYTIAICDRGPGVDPNDQARVFEPFFSQRSGGTGLGLSVCRGIIDAHGGSIGVGSRDDGANGARFFFELPVTTS